MPESGFVFHLLSPDIDAPMLDQGKNNEGYMDSFLHHITSFNWAWLDWRSLVVGLGIMSVLAYGRKAIAKFVTKWGVTAINCLLWVVERFVSRSIRARLSMARYCRNRLSVDGTRLLHVPGRRDSALDVDEVFVPLMLEQGGRGDPTSSSDLLEKGSRLIVVGDPGSGKSTLVKRLYRDSCRETAKKPRQGKLPILLELRSLEPPAKLRGGDAAAGDWLLGVLKDHVGQIEGFEMDQLFASWSTNAGLVVLLDGLDEVGSDRYPIIASALRGLSRRLAAMSPDNTIIVTMRIQFHQQVGGQFLDDYPKTLYVSPFSPNEIYLFLANWPFRDKDRQESIRKIYAELADRPTLREMCQNPLILAMYVQNSLESGAGELPSTRTEFYDKVVTELLVKRRARQEMNSRTSSALREQRESLLGQLALENMTNSDQPVNSLSWKRATELAEKVWKCSADQAEVRLLELASATGIISEEKSGETFRFIHQTFCEFLAASECAKRRKNGWRDLMATHRSFHRSGEAWLQTRLLEVLPFAQALLPQHARSAALADIAELGDGPILGRCFLETQLYDQPEWEGYVAEEREILSKDALAGWSELTLRRLQLLSVVSRDARDWATETGVTVVDADLQQMFASIVSENSQLIATVFGTYARQDAAAALRLADEMGIDLLSEHLGVAIEACQEAPFRDLMVDRVTSDTSGRTSLVLFEAALRYQSVAATLDALEWASPIDWSRTAMDSLIAACRIKPGSVYAALARAAFQNPISRLEDFPATAVLVGYAPITRRFNIKSFLISASPLAALAFSFLSLLVTAGNVRSSDWLHSLWAQALFAAGVLFLMIITGSIALPVVTYRLSLFLEIANTSASSDKNNLAGPFGFIIPQPIRFFLRRDIAALQALNDLRPDSTSMVLKGLKVGGTSLSLLPSYLTLRFGRYRLDVIRSVGR